VDKKLPCLNIVAIDDEVLLPYMIANTLRLDDHNVVALSDPRGTLDYESRTISN
jgi:hypothetical protein